MEITGTDFSSSEPTGCLLYGMNGTHFADLARKRDAESSSQKKMQSVTPPDDSYRYGDLEELAPSVPATFHTCTE